MEALPNFTSISSLHIPNLLTQTPKLSNFHSLPLTTSSPRLKPTRSKLFRSRVISPVSAEPSPPEIESEVDTGGEKFDWYSQWYPVMPVCDLDKRVPHAKKVLGIDVVVWWDKNENAWKVFDDMCPHRLAPLSEGRIDQWGRLQCVYHGWCFDGSGNCKLIPQAPLGGPPVHTNKRACVAAYPTVLHHELVWFWPNSDPQYKDILEKKKPPFIPELDDPSFTKLMGNRDINYGYDILVENLMDPAHVPYAHYGLMQTRKPDVKRDREGGRPLDFTVKTLDMSGFDGKTEIGVAQFTAPCIFSLRTDPEPLADQKERKIKEIGPANWQKACFVPTKADALVVGFRRWFNKYAGGEVDWRGKYSGELPPTPPREQLMDRYWTHVVNCKSCSRAYKSLNALETILQVVAVGLLGIAAAAREGIMSAASRSKLAILAALCFVASKWLAHLVYKNFRYHDYSHALI
ncbi:Protochlorophyllide-dependent translocon component 52, chloroplastic [Linum perenne]